MSSLVKKAFAVRSSSIGIAKNNARYLDLILCDGEIDINAKQWDYKGDSPDENSVIVVDGVMDLYKGKKQVKINSWCYAAEGEYAPQDFMLSVSNIADIRSGIHSLAKEINSEFLRSLVMSLVVENKMFFEAPASMYHHHDYLGGLAEHSLDVAVTARNISTSTDIEIDMDMLTAASLLHDIGKINCYDWSGCTIQMKDRGKLLDHIAMGITKVEIESCHLDHIPYSEEEDLHLLHCIASHHGERDWGSPVEPKTKEALILHFADNLDSKLWKIKDAEESCGEKRWTDKVYGMNRDFYKGGK